MNITYFRKLSSALRFRLGAFQRYISQRLKHLGKFHFSVDELNRTSIHVLKLRWS